jgi:[ribosomal protein S5]-alanine N-acetyltransferase
LGLKIKAKTVESKRLSILKISDDGVDKFEAMSFTYNVMKYTAGKALTTQEAIERYVWLTDEPYLGNYFVTLKETQQTVGIAKIAEDGVNTIEIGYSLFEAFWGAGLGTELAQLLIDFSNNNLSPQVMTAYTDPRNVASQRVLEKVGFQKIAEKERRQGIMSYFYEMKVPK